MIESQHDAFYLQRVRVSDEYVGKPRLDVFRSICEGARVLHVGCAGYPFTDVRNNLHVQLAPFCDTLDGFDTHPEVYPLLRPHVPRGAFLDSLRAASTYDVVLIPEVLEHVGNAQDFLGQVSSVRATRFVLTVPDLFQCYRRHFEYQQEKGVFLEAVHPDHNCWYSPYTISHTIQNYTRWTIDGLYWFNGISILVSCSFSPQPASP